MNTKFAHGMPPGYGTDHQTYLVWDARAEEYFVVVRDEDIRDSWYLPGEGLEVAWREWWYWTPLRDEGPFHLEEGEVTPEDVRQALGLMPPEEWAEERSRLDLPPYRRLGRTTEMLLKAVAAALNGKQVLIYGYSARYSKQLRQQAESMVAQFPFPATGRFPNGRRDVLRSGQQVVVFHDHYPAGARPVRRQPVTK